MEQTYSDYILEDIMRNYKIGNLWMLGVFPINLMVVIPMSFIYPIGYLFQVILKGGKTK